MQLLNNQGTIFTIAGLTAMQEYSLAFLRKKGLGSDKSPANIIMNATNYQSGTSTLVTDSFDRHLF